MSRNPFAPGSLPRLGIGFLLCWSWVAACSGERSEVEYRLDLSEQRPVLRCDEGVNVAWRSLSLEHADWRGFDLPAGARCSITVELPADTRFEFRALAAASTARATVSVATEVVWEEEVTASKESAAVVALPAGRVELHLAAHANDVHFGELALASPHAPPVGAADWSVPLSEALEPYLDSLPPADTRRSERRLLVVGIDGASWDTFAPVLEQGLLPSLAELRARGRYGALRSTAVPESAQAWTMVQTGVDAGRHGVFTFLDPDTRFPAYWQQLGASGLSSIILAVPKASPLPPVRGALVGGWTQRKDQEFAQPPALLAGLRRARYDPRLVNVRNVDRFNRQTRLRGELAAALLASSPWDHVFVVFEYSDTVAHQFGLYSSEWVSALREIDAALARILAVIEPETTVLVLSDHGWRRYECALDLDRWLERSEIAGWKTGLPSSANVIGLERKAGEAASFDPVRDALDRFRHPESGDPLIARVYPSAEAFQGPKRNEAPAELLVEAREDCRILYGERQPEPWERRTVDHHARDGIFLLAGPGIEPGPAPRASVRDVAPSVLGFYGLAAPEALSGDAWWSADGLASPPDPEDGGEAAEPGEVDPELRQTLRTLGYVE